jgi:hypothetical protein
VVQCHQAVKLDPTVLVAYLTGGAVNAAGPWIATQETSSLTVLRIRAMNVWTEVNSNATGNQIPAPPDTRHNWLSLWRLGGQLVGRLDPEPAVLSGDGRARSTLRKVNELSPLRRWIARGFSRPASRFCPATTVSFEPPALLHYRVGRPF